MKLIYDAFTGKYLFVPDSMLPAGGGSEPAVPAYSAPYNPISDNDGDWLITASSVLNSSRAAYKAFDTDIEENSGEWHSSGSLPQYIQWRNTASPILIKKYTVTMRSNGGAWPTDWQLQGSDDGVAWNTIDTVTNASVGDGVTVERVIDNNAAFHYHRIYVTRSTGSNSGYAAIGFIAAWSSADGTAYPEEPDEPDQPETGSYLQVTVSGVDTTAGVPGKYTLVDATATGIDRIWKHESAGYWICALNNATATWILTNTDPTGGRPSSTTSSLWYVTGSDDPYDSTTGATLSWEVMNGLGDLSVVLKDSAAPPTTEGEYLSVAGYTGSSAYINGQYNCVNPDAAATDRMYRHETEAILVARCEQTTEYWALHPTTEDENIRPDSPSGAFAYFNLLGHTGSVPWEVPDGDWMNVESGDTITVTHHDA